MPDLAFAIEGAKTAPYAASPQLQLLLRIEDRIPDERVHSAMLTCQVQIDPARRSYSPAEEALLHDLFGERARWGETLRPLAWAQPVVLVPGFSGATTVAVPLACTIDLLQGPAKFLFALEDGEVPIRLLPSGTVFHAGPTGALQAAPVPWDREASFRIPVALVKQVATAHHLSAAFLPLERETFDRLHAYRLERRLPTWERTVESLLARAARAPEAA